MMELVPVPVISALILMLLYALRVSVFEAHPEIGLEILILPGPEGPIRQLTVPEGKQLGAAEL
jgi:hypothetical protein